ncbi:hypothetical protein [Streptomyces sp. NPDC002855]|uniref:hypothetical protein n=1 Tax=Streptomyces sp. NPDC002855 TaxID=3154437 RepID=UPI003330CAAA
MSLRKRASNAPVWWTVIVCTIAGTAGHAMLWISYANDWSRAVPWQPVTGISLLVIAVVSYGGFYVASRRARIAIASSFLLTFLAVLTYVLTIRALADASQSYGNETFDDFRWIVQTVIWAYFGSEAIVSTTKVIAAKRTATNPSEIQRSDADLVLPERPTSTGTAGTTEE